MYNQTTISTCFLVSTLWILGAHFGDFFQGYMMGTPSATKTIISGPETSSETTTTGTRGRNRIQSPQLPLCNLESLDDANALEDAVWVDPLDANYSKYSNRTLLKRPTSKDMLKNLEERIWKDQDDAERLTRVGRLQLDTRGHCRIQEWDPADFSKCLQNRRMIFVGDSMTMQQIESLSYLTSTWNKTDTGDRRKGRCRHCIDATTKSGLHIMGRAIFHSDEEDMTPLRFNREAWEMMVHDFGGWKKGDILLVNFGAHYMNSLMDIRMDLTSLFNDVLSKISKDDVTVFWRDYAPAQ
jgi:hypothetical protein